MADRGWWDDLPDVGPAFRDMMEEFADEGLGPPDTWDRYEIHIHDSGLVEAVITDDEGLVVSTEGMVDFETETPDWAWGIWDWLEDHARGYTPKSGGPFVPIDVDMESIYEE